MLHVAVARSSSDDSDYAVVMLCTLGFVEDFVFT